MCLSSFFFRAVVTSSHIEAGELVDSNVSITKSRNGSSVTDRTIIHIYKVPPQVFVSIETPNLSSIQYDIVCGNALLIFYEIHDCTCSNSNRRLHKRFDRDVIKFFICLEKNKST